MKKYLWIIGILIVLSSLIVGSLNCGEPAPSESTSPTTPPSSTTPSTSSTQPPAATPQSSTPPAESSEGELTVISKIIGDVRILRAGETEWEPTIVGTMLNPGDRVKTMIGANALITFFDGSSIYLNELTEIAINEVSIEDGTGAININIWQEIGKTRSRVNKLVDPASRYEVQTPAGSAVARGSTADVTVYWDGTTYILNIAGNWYAFVDGQWISIEPGTGLKLSLDVPPGVPTIPSYMLEQGDGSSSSGGGRQNGGGLNGLDHDY